MRPLRVTTLIVFCLGLLLAPAADAHHAVSPAQAAGLKRVVPEVGPPFYTHGVDPFEHAAFGAVSGPVAEQPTPNTPRRRIACATDQFFQAVYAYQADKKPADKQITKRIRQIRSVLERSNYYLSEQSVLAGGPWIDLKFACTDQRSRQISVKQVGLRKRGFRGMVSELREKGFRKPNVDYVVFADFLHPLLGCGVAEMVVDETVRRDNAANTENGIGAIWQPCWESPTPLHEMAHLMGAVQPNAPHGTGYGGFHCNQGHDIMCYTPDGGERRQGGMVIHCKNKMRFDCGYDDYFNPAPKPQGYLANHWNLGSPLNRSIAFEGRPANPPKPVKPTIRPPKGKGKGERKKLRGGRWYERKAAPAGRTSVYRFGKLPRKTRRLRVVVRGARKGGKLGPILKLRLEQHGLKRCRRITSGERVRCRVRRPGRSGWKVKVRTMAYGGKPFRIQISWK